MQLINSFFLLSVLCFQLLQAEESWKIPLGKTGRHIQVRESKLNLHTDLLQYKQEKNGLYRFEYQFPGGYFKGLVSGWNEAVFLRWKEGKLTLKDLEAIEDYWLSLVLDLGLLAQRFQNKIQSVRKKYPVPYLDIKAGNDSVHVSAQTRWNLVKPIIPWFPGISLIDNHTPVNFSLVIKPVVKKQLLFLEFVHARLLDHDLTSTFNSVFIPRFYLDLKQVPLFDRNVRVKIDQQKLFLSSKSRADSKT